MKISSHTLISFANFAISSFPAVIVSTVCKSNARYVSNSVKLRRIRSKRYAGDFLFLSKELCTMNSSCYIIKSVYAIIITLSYLGQIFKFLAIIKAHFDCIIKVVQIPPTWEQIETIVESGFALACITTVKPTAHLFRPVMHNPLHSRLS